MFALHEDPTPQSMRTWRERLFGVHPHPAVLQSRAAFAHRDPDARLDETDFVVLDLETTGLDPDTCEIISIGAVRLTGLTIDTASAPFETLVRPRTVPDGENVLIHRITPGQLTHAPAPQDVLPDLLDFIGSRYVIGHHVGMDMGFINRACTRTLGGALTVPCLDTLRMAQIYHEQCFVNYYDQFNLSVGFSLAQLAERYGLPAYPGTFAHNALADAMQTACLFLYLAKKLSTPAGGSITTLRQLFSAGRSWRWYF